MGAEIKAGEGWKKYNFEAYWQAYAASVEQLKEYATKIGFVESLEIDGSIDDGPFWEPILAGTTIDLQPGKIALLSYRKSAEIRVITTDSTTDVLLEEVAKTAKITASGDFIPPHWHPVLTLYENSYALVGPEAVFQYQPNTPNSLKITNQVESEDKSIEGKI